MTAAAISTPGMLALSPGNIPQIATLQQILIRSVQVVCNAACAAWPTQSEHAPGWVYATSTARADRRGDHLTGINAAPRATGARAVQIAAIGAVQTFIPARGISFLATHCLRRRHDLLGIRGLALPLGGMVAAYKPDTSTVSAYWWRPPILSSISLPAPPTDASARPARAFAEQRRGFRLPTRNRPTARDAAVHLLLLPAYWKADATLRVRGSWAGGSWFGGGSRCLRTACTTRIAGSRWLRLR